MDITLEPNSERQVDLPVPWTFDAGLVEGVHSLPEQVVVMDGVCKGTIRNGQPVCPIVMANFSHLPIKLSAYSPLAKIADSSNLQMFPLQDCLTITNGRPRLEKIDHVENIDLSHLPEQYQQRYKSLLRANADVFSRNDLDVGHCKSLPHKVRLRDPNRITAINQYRLPYHLKEVAMFFQQHLIDPQEATNFGIPGVGQYTYCRSLQGLNSSPAYFQRLLDYVLNGIARVYVYIDDVVISVKTHDENLQNLSEVFSRFRKHNLKIKPSKCSIGTARITYLGYDICKKEGIRLDMQKQRSLKTGRSHNY